MSKYSDPCPWCLDGVKCPAHPIPRHPMRSKNSRAIGPRAAAHLEAVKGLACSVCNAPGPSEAHHIEQGAHFVTVALCADCHRGSFNGIHGQRRMWTVMKMDELSALNVTIERLTA